MMANDKYIGDGSFTGGLRALRDIRVRSFSVAGNLVGVLRETFGVLEMQNLAMNCATPWRLVIG